MRQLANPHHHVLTRQNATDFAAVLKALAHPVRLQILSLLLHAPDGLRVLDLQAELGCDQAWVSANLRPLVVEGFVVRELRGLPYRIVPGALDFVSAFLAGPR